MADALIGEIRAFSFDFVPEGWCLCDGSELSVTQNQALFSVISNRFGGDGRKTFKLPDLRSALGVGAGEGAGLTKRELADRWGVETVTLKLAETPAHQHTVNARIPNAGTNLLNTPDSTVRIARTANQLDFANIDIDPWKVTDGFSQKVISSSGGGEAHENRQPVLAMIYCICLDGDYPSRD